jgi:hypothetical protein
MLSVARARCTYRGGKLFPPRRGFARLRDYAKRTGLAALTRTPFPT